MTCKDCLHYEACRDWDEDECILDGMVECRNFKDKSRFVEIRCRVGDTVYQINRTPYGGEVYELVIFDVSLRKYKPYYETESIDFCNAAIGTSIFLTREEAEKALAEREEKRK